MGRRIIAQRRGRGTSTFRVPEKSFSPKIEYNNQVGVVTDLVHDARRDTEMDEGPSRNGWAWPRHGLSDRK